MNGQLHTPPTLARRKEPQVPVRKEVWWSLELGLDTVGEKKRKITTPTGTRIMGTSGLFLSNFLQCCTNVKLLAHFHLMQSLWMRGDLHLGIIQAWKVRHSDAGVTLLCFTLYNSPYLWTGHRD